jgi:hypothetical protein
MTALNHEIDLNLDNIAHADPSDKTDQVLQPREVLIPELDGSSVVLKRRQVLCGASYHAGLPITAFDFPWRFVPASTTGGTVSLGKVWVGSGADKTVTSFPSGGILSGVTTTTIYWIAADFYNATATWGSGSSLPANTATVHYWRVLVLTCADSVITGIFQPWPSDIHALINP